MKKRFNSVNSWSAKSKISAAVLCAMLGTTGINAKDYPSTDPNRVSREFRSVSEADNRLNSNSLSNPASYRNEVVKNEMTLVLEEWIANSSYWSLDDSVLIEPKELKVPVKAGKCSNAENEPFLNIPFIFKAETYIPDSEF